MKPVTVEKILLEFDPEQGNILPVLKRINAAFGYVSETDAKKMADYFSVSLSHIFELASFYSLIGTKKDSDIVIKICSGTNCTVQGSSCLIAEVEKYFGIKAGDEFNPKVRLEVISCLGRCGEGPIMMVNGRIYTKVTVSGARDILENME
ncbi:MAG: hypothetical protein HGB08_00680 [Candidatus Moranbacteria bacterium]|nr:hypothetical protein [Candidatus Moranbacteria bacterium]